MKLSKLIGLRFKEKPSETKLISHEFLLRGGYVRQVSNGIFTHLLPTKKIILNIEAIIRDEMNKVDGQEVSMPLVQPAELWEASGRFETIQEELLRFKDRTDHGMVLAMTHEETATTLAKSETSSYKEYPFMIYQFSKKFRDEARARGGLIRLKEFEMKDAYSFHTSEADMESYYERCMVAYNNIFRRVGIPQVISIKSDNGIMGGSISHEYMLLTPSGEDTIIICDKCGYTANKEVATSISQGKFQDEAEAALEKVSTPDTKTIEDLAKLLGVEEARCAKCVFYQGREDDDLVLALVRGDLDINEVKLAKILKKQITAADDALITKAGCVPGFASPIGIDLSKLTLLVDKSLKGEKNLVSGANEKDFHYKNVNLGRDLKTTINYVDISNVVEGDLCPHCKAALRISRGIEVGNIFQLGDKYTKRLKMTYIDENNQPQTPIMACYGIGIDRLVGSIIEASHDERGPIWPYNIAPWKVAIVSLYQKNDAEINQKIISTSEALYDNLTKQGYEPIWDERNASAGEKFADIDLLGIPIVLVISKKNLEQGQIEVKVRKTSEKLQVEEGKIYEKIQELAETLRD